MQEKSQRGNFSVHQQKLQESAFVRSAMGRNVILPIDINLREDAILSSKDLFYNNEYENAPGHSA